MFYLIEGSNFLIWGGGKGLIHINKLQERNKSYGHSFLKVLINLQFSGLQLANYYKFFSESKKASFNSFLLIFIN